MSEDVGLQFWNQSIETRNLEMVVVSAARVTIFGRCHGQRHVDLRDGES
jgi:hypothetical protein